MTSIQVTIALAGGGLAILLGRLALAATAAPPATPERAVGQLRLARIAALTLVLVAGAWVGFAGGDTSGRATLDLVLALAFFGIAGLSAERTPPEALTLLAVAFVAHAVVDILHRPGALTEGLAPGWYLVGCALFNIYAAGVCYLAVVRR